MCKGEKMKSSRVGRPSSGKYEITTPAGVFEIRRGKRRYIRGENGGVGRHVGTWKITKAPIGDCIGKTGFSKRELIEWIQTKLTLARAGDLAGVIVDNSLSGSSVEERLDRIEKLLEELVEAKRAHSEFLSKLLGSQ